MLIILEPNTPIGPFTVGEKPAPLQYTYLDASGAPLPIVGYQVKINFREQSSQVPAQFAGVLTDGLNGIVTYIWTGVEFPTPGAWLAEFWVGNGTNRFASILCTFNVRAAVGVIPSI